MCVVGFPVLLFSFVVFLYTMERGDHLIILLIGIVGFRVIDWFSNVMGSHSS